MEKNEQGDEYLKVSFNANHLLNPRWWLVIRVQTLDSKVLPEENFGRSTRSQSTHAFALFFRKGKTDDQYYKDKTTGEMKPGSKGISLTKEQVRFSLPSVTWWGSGTADDLVGDA